MEVATTNNHNYESHRHRFRQMPNSLRRNERADEPNASTNSSRSPFQREVREWQHIDPDTGALLSGRVEADRWVNGPLNSYGKITDSQNISQPNGTQHSQRKQVEVLQARSPDGAMQQVIRTHKVQSTSSRWASSTSKIESCTFTPATQAQPLPQPQPQPQTLSKSMSKPSSHFTQSQLQSQTHAQPQPQPQPKTQTSIASSLKAVPWPAEQSNGIGQHLGLGKHFHQHQHHHSHQMSRVVDICEVEAGDSEVNTGLYVVEEGSSDEYGAVQWRLNGNQTNHANGGDAQGDDEHDDDDDVDVDVEVGGNIVIVVGTNGVRSRRNSGSSCSSTKSSSASSTSVDNFITTPQRHNHLGFDGAKKFNHHCDGQVRVRPIDTAPSLKLSNLMKSSSSIASNNSSSNDSTSSPTVAGTAVSAAAGTGAGAGAGAATKHTHTHGHSRADKVILGLRAIIDRTAITTTGTNTNTSTNTNNDSSKASHSAATSFTSPWQMALQRSSQRSEQDAVFGSARASGGGGSGGGGGGGGGTGGGRERTAAGRVGGKRADDPDRPVGDNRRGNNGLDGHHEVPDPHYRHRQQASTNDGRETTPTQSSRRDSESFRHYNGPALASSFHLSANPTDDDNDLRLTSRLQRRQQYSDDVPSGELQRSRSISTDDLNTEWDSRHTQSGSETSEWRRVSKLRRSFQSSKSTATSSTTTTTTSTSTDDRHSSRDADRNRRPTDLPANSVSVARIRAELENGRRLNTAMRGNNVDLSALSSILHGPTEVKDASEKKSASSFLTAESLKEIRGKLKRLSDESLYKDDFVTHHQQPPVADEQIEVQHFVKASAPQDTASGQFTHSLESSRQKSNRMSTSSEWHSRRKSYGFERVSPPEDASMFGMDVSTDSGLGRSGELANWSPTTEAAPTPRTTIIHFGEPVKVLAGQSVVEKRNRYLKSVQQLESDNLKRHSIAVDETQYMGGSSGAGGAGGAGVAAGAGISIRQTSQVLLNGLQATEEGSPSVSSLFQRSTQPKRVEFCKTEVHFAAESGRVNIVETDGKPPPTNNFRRRRRNVAPSAGPLQSLVKGAPLVASTEDTSINAATTLPVTRFGDERRKMVTGTAIVESIPDSAPSNVTVSIPKPTGGEVRSRASYTSTSGVDTTDNENDEMATIRGILKNKPIKPKPYHLGENFDSADALWVAVQPTSRPELRSSDLLDSEVPATERRAPEGHEMLVSGFSTKINLSLRDEVTEWTDVAGQMGRPGCAGTGSAANANVHMQQLLAETMHEQQRTLGEGLKSTALIIQTMRSANEFDEAMRRLSIASVEAAATPIASTLLERSARTVKAGQQVTVSQPVAAPRITALSHAEFPDQLSQLRRVYETEAFHHPTDDSADEEVKSYFSGHADYSDSGGGTQDSSSLEEEHFQSFEYSGNWQHLRGSTLMGRADFPPAAASNANANATTATTATATATATTTSKVSIALHAPKMEKPPVRQRTVTPPVAKPRSLTKPKGAPIEPPKGPDNSTMQQVQGARQLRDHELAYFGLPVSRGHESDDHQPAPRKSKQYNASLAYDNKPDLLRHSSVGPGIEAARKSLSPVEKILANDSEPLTEDDEHYYENISTELQPVFKVRPEPYDRKMDVQRDAMILSEMNHTADQTMKALSDEAAYKEKRRRSQQRRNSQPLETIAERPVRSEGMAKRGSRHNTPPPSTPTMASRVRSSSQSSVESCPRARSRSLSSEREYENVPVAPMRQRASKPSKAVTKRTSSRSSSKESQLSQQTPCSSGDEMCQRARNRELRSRSRRPTNDAKTIPTTKTKTAISTKSTTSAGSAAKRSAVHSDSKHTSSSRNEHAAHRSSRTTHSSQKERIECVKDAAASSHHHPQARVVKVTVDGSVRHPREEHSHEAKVSSSAGMRVGSSNGIRLLRPSRTHHDKPKEREKPSRSRDHSSPSMAQPHRSSERAVSSKHHSASSGASVTRSREHSRHPMQAVALTTTTAAAAVPAAAAKTEAIAPAPAPASAPTPATGLTTNSGETKSHRHAHSHAHGHAHAHTHESASSRDLKMQSKNPAYIMDADYQQQQQRTEHIHQLTTATIATKHRLHRNGKDRK